MRCDENIKSSKRTHDLYRNGVYIFLPGHVTDNAACIRQLLHDPFHPVLAPRDERDLGTAIQEFADEGQAKAGSAAGNSDSTPEERVERRVICRGELRRSRVDSFVMDMHESSFCRKGVMVCHIFRLQVKVNLKSSTNPFSLSLCPACLQSPRLRVEVALPRRRSGSMKSEAWSSPNVQAQVTVGIRGRFFDGSRSLSSLSEWV
jgi:hypothetical protein